MACVALPTCGLALAESERYLPDLMTELEESLASHGLAEEEITIRSTGCPNGCARPFIAEIGLVGRGPERYHLYLGAAFDGSRLSKLYKEDVAASEIRDTLDPLFADYAKGRRAGRAFRRLPDPRRPRGQDHQRPGLPRADRGAQAGRERLRARPVHIRVTGCAQAPRRRGVVAERGWPQIPARSCNPPLRAFRRGGVKLPPQAGSTP